MDHEVKIGYSFWGFLGPGVTDTPDGGRSHRRVLIDGLRSRGHDPVFLQPDRDLTEAGLDLSEIYSWDVGLPEIDVLFLEWRWPIPGRNTSWCGAAGHTCDMHRQQELLDHYTRALGTLTILWDKDRQLPADDPLRATGNVVVCEAAAHPTPGAVSLLFPVADAALAAADPTVLAATPRHIPLAYVGNQYDRDAAFDMFFAPAAASHRHVVAGKWTRTDAWPHVSFIGRVPFTEVAEIYSRSLATVLLLPGRYARSGQMTQRLVEAVLAGCLPLTPASTRSADRFTPRRLHVANGAEVAAMLAHLMDIAGTSEHVELIAACLRALEIFRVSRQLDVLDKLLAGQLGREVVTS
ncbi:MAG: glycosyltransferase family protein [Pseudonocardiaceae bacterium]